MIILGIESTAHTFGAGIINEKKEILANEKSSFTTKQGGIHPRKAAEHHSQNVLSVVKKAMEKSKLSWNQIDGIAFSQGPGLGPCLKVGAVAARTLSIIHNKPLFPVNHCIAHIEIAKVLGKAKNPIIVFTSGANTQIIGLENKKYRIFGETLDTGLGNMLDSFGRKIGLGFPAGPVLDKWYFEGKKLVELPYTVKGMDLAFSGLQTAAEQKIGKENKKDLAYSLLHNAFAMVTEVTERALAHTRKKEVIITGGVAASKALRQMIQKMCYERGAKAFVPPVEFCVDNGLMIAWNGLLLSKSKHKENNSEIKPYQRVDQVNVSW